MVIALEITDSVKCHSSTSEKKKTTVSRSSKQNRGRGTVELGKHIVA
jgi:hypothetical protein